MHMKAKMKVVGFGLLAAGTVLAAADPAKIKELNETISKNYVSFGIWNEGYLRYHAGYKDREGDHGPRVDTKGYLAMRERYLKALAEKESLLPGDAALLLEYGEALMFDDPFAGIEPDYAAAKAKFEKTMALPKLGSWETARALYRIAECQFAGGDREGCKKTLEDLVSRKINTVARYRPNWSGSAQMALGFLKGEIVQMDDLKLPAFTDAKPYPEPQQAKYEDAFASLAEMEIDLNGVDEDDARVRLLKTRLDRLGVKYGFRHWYTFGSAPFTLTVELTDEAPVAEREGYALDVAKDGATVRARDSQGVLWGLVSFMQMIDYGAKAVRCGSVRDWPNTAKRGYLAHSWEGNAEFAVFQKMNSVDVQHPPTYDFNWSPLRVFCAEAQAHQFRDLGLELFYGVCEFTMYPALPFAWPESEEFRVHLFKRYAAMGAGVYFPFDDGRYGCALKDSKSGLPQPDEEKFKEAKNCDGEYVSRIYRAVKAEYPDFRMIFCPPFYWGPDAVAPYPGSREEYLASLARTLDPEIEVYWTGPRVKGIKKEPYQTEWYTKLTGRKPYIFQNGTGPHNLLGYVVDATDWNGWHYPGFFEKDIGGFHKNSGTPGECCQIATLADCLWNVKGYDMHRAAKRGINQLLGEKMYDILAPGLPALAYFDKYKYGRLTADILHEDVKDLEAKVALAEDCWKKAVAYNPSVQMYGAYGRGIGWAKDVVRGAKKPPDFLAQYKDQIAASRALAEKEVGVDKSKGDLFYSPVDIGGGQVQMQREGGKDKLPPGRFVTALRGASTCFNALKISFECDPFPPSGDYALYLCGLDDELPAKNAVRIEVNGTTVFEGDPGFVNATAYSVRKFTIPFKAMKRYNQLRIVSLAPGSTPVIPPWTFISYAVVKKEAK